MWQARWWGLPRHSSRTQARHGEQWNTVCLQSIEGVGGYAPRHVTSLSFFLPSFPQRHLSPSSLSPLSFFPPVQWFVPLLMLPLMTQLLPPSPYSAYKARRWSHLAAIYLPSNTNPPTSPCNLPQYIHSTVHSTCCNVAAHTSRCV